MNSALAHADAGKAARGALLACALVNHNPTPAQKDAGNYKKEHVSFQGLPVAIENKKGSVRSGVSGNGKRWSCTLPADYGYIKRTLASDGDHIDAYVGPDPNAKQVFIVNQNDLHTDRFDEVKCFLGFDSEREALDIYSRAFSDGKGRARIGSVETVSMDAFKDWLKTGRTTAKASARSIIDRALALTAGRGAKT